MRVTTQCITTAKQVKRQQNASFKRVKEEEVVIANSALADNSFDAKKVYTQSKRVSIPFLQNSLEFHLFKNLYN